MQVKLESLKQLPEIIRESVKPMEQIEGIKIIQVDGLNAGTVAAGDGVTGVVMLLYRNTTDSDDKLSL